MNFLRWVSNLLRPKPAKYGSPLAWAADHFPVAQGDVAARVAEILVDQLNVRLDDLNGDTRFIQDLQMDDLEPMEVLAALEAAFRMTIPVEETASLETISDLVRYLDAKLHPTAA